MNRTVATVIKAIAGLVVLFVLLYTVSNWWSEYKSAGSGSPDTSTTETVSPAETEEGSGESTEDESSSEKGAEKSTVVVLVDGLNLRVDPDSDSKSVRGLNKNEKLVLLKTDGKWYQVETAEGDEGWISSSPSYTRVEKP